MSTHFAYQDTPDQLRDREEMEAAATGLPAEYLSPLLAGARARGMADAFELLGKAAVLVGETGITLHVNRIAKDMMGSALAVVSRHLIGATPSANSALQALIADAVAGRSGGSVSLPRGEGRLPLVVEALPITGAADDPSQILKAIVTIHEAAR
jgi:hypothetical protein